MIQSPLKWNICAIHVYMCVHKSVKILATFTSIRKLKMWQTWVMKIVKFLFYTIMYWMNFLQQNFIHVLILHFFFKRAGNVNLGSTCQKYLNFNKKIVNASIKSSIFLRLRKRTLFQGLDATYFSCEYFKTLIRF